MCGGLGKAGAFSQELCVTCASVTYGSFLPSREMQHRRLTGCTEWLVPLGRQKTRCRYQVFRHLLASIFTHTRTANTFKFWPTGTVLSPVPIIRERWKRELSFHRIGNCQFFYKLSWPGLPPMHCHCDTVFFAVSPSRCQIVCSGEAGATFQWRWGSAVWSAHMKISVCNSSSLVSQSCTPLQCEEGRR